MMRVGRIWAAILTGLGTGAGIIFALFAVLMTIDILGRNLGLINFPWLIETAEYGLYIATFAAAPWVLHENSHVRVDIVVGSLPRSLARAAEVLCDGLGVVISGMLFYYGLRATLEAKASGAVIIKQMILPEWWLLAVVPVTTVLLVIEFLRRMTLTLRGRLPDEVAEKHLTEGF